VVQEAVDSGIEDILIITGKGKRSIEDHFDRNFELEAVLLEKDEEAYHQVRHLAEMANIHFIRQKEMNGLGDAILYARQHVGNEPFAVLLGDTVCRSVIPATQQLIDLYDQYKSSIIAVEQVPEDKAHRYGIVGGHEISSGLLRLDTLIEKPAKGTAPSNFAIAGRYILSPEIFSVLDITPKGKNNELQLTDALKILLGKEDVYAFAYEGQRYDIGNKLDYLKTTVEFALEREEFKAPFLAFLKEIIAAQ
jgi:UTP--glucose-1-phosphate uridylyltransferase